jgi:hypothetical protein
MANKSSNNGKTQAEKMPEDSEIYVKKKKIKKTIPK